MFGLDVAKGRCFETVRIAHPTVYEPKLADTVFILVGRVVAGVDVFEPVAALLKLVEHVGPLINDRAVGSRSHCSSNRSRYSCRGRSARALRALRWGRSRDHNQ